MSDSTEFFDKEDESEETSTRVDYRGEGENVDPLARKMSYIDDAEYMKSRVDDQINFFNSKSSQAKKNYRRLKNREILISSMIPFVITLSGFGFAANDLQITENFGFDTILQIAAALGGVYLVVINKKEDLEKNFTIWKEYRATCEQLQHERYLYLAKAEPYDEDDAFALFVTGIEGILHKETQRWMQIQRSDQKKKSEDTTNVNTPLQPKTGVK